MANDRRALAMALRRVGQLTVEFPEIAKLDVNPLLALETGVIAVDARLARPPQFVGERPMNNPGSPY